MIRRETSRWLCSVGFALVVGCTPAGGPVGDSNDNANPPPVDESEVQLAAWNSGRIVYADYIAGSIVVVDKNGANPDVLIAAENPADPAVSGDGGTIAFSRRERDDDQLVVIRRSGAVDRFSGLTGHDPLRVALNRDGSRIAFQEVIPPSPTNGCGPIHLVMGNTDGTDLEAVVTGETICAEWPEWSPDGTLLAYAHVDLSAAILGRLCLLDGVTGATVRCFDEPAIGISHRTWSPDSTLLMGQGFRAIRVADGQEVTDPLAEVTGRDPELESGDLGDAIVNAVEAIGWTLVPAGQSGGVLPISLSWGSDNLLVFDALASQDGGGEAVHIFTFDLAAGVAVHVAGPFPEDNTNQHNYSLLNPRWIP